MEKAAVLDIVVIGTGAMGSIYAGLLADAGHRVVAITRSSEQAEAINGAGLRIEGPGGNRSVAVTARTSAPDAPVDLVVIATKAAAARGAAENALKAVGPDTVVLTTQNGLGSAEAVADVVGSSRVLVGIASGFGATLVHPAHVRHAAMKALRFGPYGTLPTARAQTIAAAWRSAGFSVEIVEDILAMQWEKLICNVAYSGPCTLAHATVGEVMQDPAMVQVSEDAAIEAWNVARAIGVGMTVEDPISHIREFGEAVAAAKPSVLLDHERNVPTEIDFINGAVASEARKHGLQAPVNRTITALVHRLERTCRH